MSRTAEYGIYWDVLRLWGKLCVCVCHTLFAESHISVCLGRADDLRPEQAQLQVRLGEVAPKFGGKICENLHFLWVFHGIPPFIYRCSSPSFSRIHVSRCFQFGLPFRCSDHDCQVDVNAPLREWNARSLRFLELGCLLAIFCLWSAPKAWFSQRRW